MRARVDIVVVGAGSAGIAAAVCAARAGARTLLLDQRPAAGGTGGFSGLTTLCGLYDDQGNMLAEGFAGEFASLLAESAPVQMGRVWVLPYRPRTFRALASRFVTTTPGLEAGWNTALARVTCEQGRITTLNGMEVGAVIDCSGTAEVARAIGLSTLATDDSTQAPAVIFPLRRVTRSLTSAAEMAQVLLPLARAGFAPLNLQAGPELGEMTAKYAGAPDQVAAVVSLLRAQVPGFENCEWSSEEVTVAWREGRMISGLHVLTGEDVLTGRKFGDAVARCAWPIEQWDARGTVRFRYLRPGTYYEVPARCLQAAQISNLFMGGKTISADADAIGSARVMGCCLATGAAAGVLAAKHVASAP